MKSIFNKLTIVAVASALLWACKKDETQVVLTGSGAPILSKVAAKDTLVLLEDSASKAASELIIAAIAHHRDRRGPRADMIAGLIFRDRQSHQRIQVCHQTLADGFVVTTELVALAIQAPLFQMCVQIIKAVIARCRHHEVAAGVTDHAFDVAFIVSTRWPAKLVIK